METDTSGAGSSRRHWIGLFYLLMAVLFWGLGLPAVKFAVHEWPPLTFRGLAGVIASLCLVIVALMKGERIRVPGSMFGRLLLASAFNVFAWLGLPTIALVWLSVGESVPLVFSMPVWAMLFSWLVLGSRPNLRSGVALALGIAGIGVLFVAPDLAFDRYKLIGSICALAAAVLFALGTVTTRFTFPLPATTVAAWQLGLGCLPMLIGGLLIERPAFQSLSAKGWLAVIYVAIATTACAYICWFAALRILPAATASIGLLLVPVVGVIGAAVMLSEPVTSREILALALTLAGAGLSLTPTSVKLTPEQR